MVIYLYLGQDTVVNSEDVIGIFDLDNTTTSRITKQYLAQAQQQNRVISVNQELPKSFVVCQTKQNITVYLSQISPATLKKRAEI